MNIKTTFSFYVNSNTIREMVLDLTGLSRQVFEISLNSSLITDELSTHGESYKSYSVYSEKINNISSGLNTICKTMVFLSTKMMETSLESTKYTERLERLRFSLDMISEGSNYQIIERAGRTLSDRIAPQLETLEDTIKSVQSHLEEFEKSLKKLWLLCNNMKAHVEKEEISSLNTIIRKIEFVLDNAGGNVHRLYASLGGLKNQLKENEV